MDGQLIKHYLEVYGKWHELSIARKNRGNM